MENRSKQIGDFADAVSGIQDVRALELVDLSDDELSEVSAGVAALADPIRAACQVVLEDWPQLDAGARVAALLVLANALADLSDANRVG